MKRHLFWIIVVVLPSLAPLHGVAPLFGHIL